MPDLSLSIDGVRVPRFLYGTAWKEQETARLTGLALRAGFRGIDTANQRRHYHEAAVGEAIAAAVASGPLRRDDLFVQTKFTFRPGQDHRLPYDTGRARLLGVSNVTLEQLDRLCQGARVRPRFVQNRCYAARGWDRDVRSFCAANGLVYQGFSLLTANREAMARPELARIAARHGRTVSQVVFWFALDVGMMALTGTTDPGHMRADLDVLDFRLEPDEVERIEGLVPR